jgi:hypothetical protein
VEQVVEESTVVNDGLAQLFGVALPPAARVGERLCGAVVLDDIGMIDREIRDPLFEIVRGVAARAHDLFDEIVGRKNGFGRIVHELSLNSAPGRRKSSAFDLVQPMKPDVTDAPLA